MAFNVGAIVATMVLDKKKWQTAMRDVKQNQKTFAGIVEKNSERIKGMGRAFTIAGAAIVGVFALMIREAIKFNAEMANVATLIPKSGDRINELKEDVRDLAIGVGKGTSDITGGLYQVISAFGDTSDTMKILTINAKAATAGMSTTKEAIDLTSAVTKGYGEVTSKTVKKASDLAFMTVKLGQTTFPELAASMGRVIPIAKKMNVSQEELFAGFATLSGVTGNTAEVSTQLAGVMRALIKPTDTMKKTLNELGYASGEAMIKELGLIETLKTLVEQTDGSTISVGKLFRRAEGLTALFSLTDAQVKKYNFSLKEMRKSTGAMNEAFKEVSEGVNKAGFEFKQTRVQISIAAQRIGEQLLPILSMLMKTVSSVVSWISDFVKQNEVLAKAIIVLVAGIGGLLAVLGPFLFMLPNLVKGFVMMKKVIGAVHPAILVLTVAIAAVKLGFDIWIASMEKAMRKMVQMANKEKSATDMVRAYRKQADKEQQEYINRAIKRFRDQKVEHGEMMVFIRDQLKKTSQAFRNFEKGEEEITKKTKEQLEEEKRIRKQNADAIISITTAIKDKIAELTLSEFDLRRRELKKWFDDQTVLLRKAGAEEKTFLELRRAYSLDMKQIKEDETEFLQEQNEVKLENERLLNEQIMEINNVVLQRTQQNAELVMQTYKKMQNEKALLGLHGLNRDLAILDQEKEDELKQLKERLGNTVWFEMAKANVEDTYRIRKKKLEDEWREDNENQNKITFNKIIQIASQAIGIIGTMFYQSTQKRMEQLQTEYDERKQQIIDNIEDETEREKALEALDAEFHQKKSEANIKAAKQERAVALMGAIVNTAAAVAKALPNIPLAIAVGILGAIQISLIRGQTLPGAEEGAYVEKTGVAELHAGEIVADEEKIRSVLEGGGGETNITFNIKTLDATDFSRIIHEKIIPELQDAAKDENFLIQSNAIKDNV